MTFAYDTNSVRVVFGDGSLASLPDELARCGFRKVMLLTTPRRSPDRDNVLTLLGAHLVGEFSGAKLHVPVEVVVEARMALEHFSPDSLLAFGGGSSIGLGKALAFETRLPLAVIATTYSGSEMTSVWGNSDGRMKRTFRNKEVAPCLVIYDPELTLGLPAAVSASSGMNAIAHCVEAEYAPEAGPVTSHFALEGLRLLVGSLPTVVAMPHDAGGRRDALLGAHYAGRALDMTSMGLEHKLAHVMGGRFGLNHAEAHAALVPWVTSWNAPAASEAMHRMADAAGAGDIGVGLVDLSRQLGIRSLGAQGFTAGGIDEAAGLIMGMEFPNPRPVTADGVRWILERAIEG